MRFKKTASTILGMSLLFSSAYPSFAVEKKLDQSEETLLMKSKGLSDEEFEYLQSIGLSNEDIEAIGTEIAKQLVIDQAELQVKGDWVTPMEEAKPGEHTIMGDVISDASLTFKGYAFKVTSDRANHDKYYFLGDFNWNKKPFWTLTDGLSIGFAPDHKFILPMDANGNVAQHNHKNEVDVQGNGVWKTVANDTTVESWEPNAGVGGKFDLRGDTEFTDNRGYIGQYVYVSSSANGTMNIKFRYGHLIASLGSVSFGVFPTGLAVEISSDTDYKDFGLELKY